MSSYAVSNETVWAVHEDAAANHHDAARDILKTEMKELSERNIDIAIRLACKIGGAPDEISGRLAHLSAMKEQSASAEFSYLAAGVNGLVPKPIDWPSFAAALDACAGGRSPEAGR